MLRNGELGALGSELTDEPALPVAPAASAAAGPTPPPVTEDSFHRMAQKDAAKEKRETEGSDYTKGI